MSSKKVFQKIIDKLFNYGFSTNEINSRFNMLRLLLKHNKYLYKTINFIIFEKEFYKLDFKILEYITRYKEVGDKICDIYLNHHDKLLIFILSNININVIFNKKLFNKILAFFDNNNLIIRKIENNINKIEFNTLMEYIYRNSSSYGVYRTLNYKDQIDKSLIIEIIDNHVILDNKFVGFISSEGGCGIIADNINDFFNFLAICKNLQSYFYRGVFDNIESFNKKVKEVNDEDVSPEEHTIFEKFIKDNNFITDTNILYKKLKAALITEPAFILQANPDEYSQWDDVFYTEQEYINELRKNR